MAVTIKDVAKQANVATSTVSRVISDSPNISDRTKRKVRKVMEEMGYHINLNARVLVQQSTQNIGIVMKDSTIESLHDPFFPVALQGISSYAHKRDFSISITTGETEEAIFRDVEKMVQGKRVDGMIVTYSKENDKVVPYLLKCGIPFVVVGKPVVHTDEIMFVNNDNVQAAKDATEHLIQLGHQEIAIILGDREFEITDSRLKGYREVLESNNIPINDAFIKQSTNMDCIKTILDELLALPVQPTAILGSDDLASLHIMSVLREKNIEVPRDISLISFNNTIVAELMNPTLTSVDTNIFQLGYEAARCIIEEIKERSTHTKSVIIPTKIRKRESTQPYKKVE
ncbi:LacI family transcriptional regulator [Paraliobacillus quinghaiensis]|uniref:LacI family transcriptional regulator n=1 Tax=Paraliobacillus quinghaiensis TaxID=470815 RepID=A0A917TEM7_9BACI|nr:LacI family DNA-binding transcriptional regulator [Paraliobacillus quinghaiensis]GGM19549.1 LacI family transcriptional regulator [Paraliobacillus quinghaiensis]